MQPAPGTWTTIQQWQEDEPPASTGVARPVDGAMFVNSVLRGLRAHACTCRGNPLAAHIAGPLFENSRWINFVVHGVWTDQPDGYLEW